MTVSRLLLRIASRMLYQHFYSLTVKRKEKEVTPLSFDVSVASQLTTQGDLELSSSTDSDASRILGLEFTSPRSTDTARERTHPGESGSWDDMSLPSLSPMPSKAGTPPISMEWSPTLSEKDVKEDQAPKAVSSSDIIETPLRRYADHKLKLDQIEFELSEPPRKRQKLASTPLEQDLAGSLALSPGSFESVSLSDLTTDDPTESFEADGNIDSSRSRPSSVVLFTLSQVGSGDEETQAHSPVSLRKVELTADEDGRGPLKDRDRASGLQVLRRSSRLAGRLCASLEGGAGLRRSPRLALKPRVRYVGMC